MTIRSNKFEGGYKEIWGSLCLWASVFFPLSCWIMGCRLGGHRLEPQLRCLWVMSTWADPITYVHFGVILTSELLSIMWGEQYVAYRGHWDYKDELRTTYSAKGPLEMKGARWLLSVNQSLSPGRESEKSQWGMKTRRGHIRMFLSRIESPFSKHDSAVQSYSSGAADMDDLMDWSWGRSKQARCHWGNVENVDQCRSQKLGGLIP